MTKAATTAEFILDIPSLCHLYVSLGSPEAQESLPHAYSHSRHPFDFRSSAFSEQSKSTRKWTRQMASKVSRKETRRVHSGGPDSLALIILAQRWVRQRGGEACEEHAPRPKPGLRA